MGLAVELFLPSSLAIIMFSLGLGLTYTDFTKILKQPKDFFLGAIIQILILPLVALAIVTVGKIPTELALGIMVLSAAPGGVTSNILTAYARGDIALSISLTAIISLISAITLPFILTISHEIIAGEKIHNISMVQTAVSIFFIVTVPVIIGLLTRRHAPGFTARIQKKVEFVSAILFAIILMGAIYEQRSNIVLYFTQAGLATLTLNLIMLTLAILLSKCFSSGLKQQIAITLECGLQNGTVAITVAALLLGGGMTIIPAAIYSLIMFPTALILVMIFRMKGKKDIQ